MPNFNITQPNGQTLSVDAPTQEAALDQVLGSAGPDVSSLGSFGRGAVGMLPLGDQAYAGIAGVAEHKPYLQERQELDKEIAADKENNPGARLAGQAAGVVAPIVATAGIAAPETLLGAAGQGALVGSGYGAGNAIDTLASGGSGAHAAGDVAMGAGLGAAGGLTSKALGELLSKLKGSGSTLEQEAATEGGALPHPEPAPSVPIPSTPNDGPITAAHGAPLPGQIAEPKAAASMQAGESGAADLGIPGNPNPVIEPAPHTLPGNGYSETTVKPAASDSELRARQAVQMWGATPRQIRKLPGKNLAQTINKLVDTAEENSTPQNDLFALTDRYNDRLQKYVNLQGQAGRVIGDTIKSAGIAPMPVKPVVEGLNSAMHFPTPDQEEQLAALSKKISEKWASPDGTIPFEKLQQLKTTLGSEAFSGKGDPVLQAAYHVVGNAQDAELERIAGTINKPAFDKAKAAYQMTSRVVPMLRMGAAKSLTGRPSLTELLSGHPIAALSKLGGERLEGIKNVIGFKAANALAKGNLGNLGVAGEAALANEAPALPTGSVMPHSAPHVAPSAPSVMPPPDFSTQTLTPPSLGADLTQPEEKSPTLDLNHPAMAPYRATFQANAAQAQGDAEVQKQNAITDFVMSQRDPGYAKAKEAANGGKPYTGVQDERIALSPAQQYVADKLKRESGTSISLAPGGKGAKIAYSKRFANGGVVPEDTTGKVDGFGSTLDGLAHLLQPQPEAAPVAPPAVAQAADPNEEFRQLVKRFMESK